jgi:hypothetical protein
MAVAAEVKAERYEKTAESLKGNTNAEKAETVSPQPEAKPNKRKSRDHKAEHSNKTTAKLAKIAGVNRIRTPMNEHPPPATAHLASAIVALLGDGPRNFDEICESIGADQPDIVRALEHCHGEDLVTSREDGAFELSARGRDLLVACRRGRRAA